MSAQVPVYLQPHELLKVVCQTGSECYLRVETLKKLTTDIDAHPEGHDFYIEDKRTGAKICMKLVEFYNHKDIIRLAKFQGLVKKITKADPTSYTWESLILPKHQSSKKLFAKGGNDLNEEDGGLMESSTVREQVINRSNPLHQVVSHESGKLRSALLNRTADLPPPTPTADVAISKDWMTQQFANVAKNFNEKFQNVETSIESINGYIKNFVSAEDVVALVDEGNNKVLKEVAEKLAVSEATNEAKFTHAIAQAVKLELETQISDGTVSLYGGSEPNANRTLTETEILIRANTYTNGCAEYRTSVYNNKRSGILQFTFMNEVLGEGEDKIWTWEKVDDEDVFKINFTNLRKALDNTTFSNLNGNKARLSKKNNMVVKLKITGLNAFNTSEKIKKIMDTKGDKIGMAIALLPPTEHDIDAILMSWKHNSIIQKFDTNRGGFYSLNINDGNTLLSGNEFYKSCSRMNVSNPRALASLTNPTIPGLRCIAAGTHFPSEGRIIELPANFFKKPINPGKVNATWTPTSDTDIAFTANINGTAQAAENVLTQV